MEEEGFDKLARIAATKTSRRQVLKAMMGVAAGGLLTRVSTAVRHTDRDPCPQFCKSHFSGADAAKCASDAQHGQGLCYSACGPGSGGTQGTGTLCGGPSYSSTTCCTGSTTCKNGQCVASCLSNGNSCTYNSDCCSNFCLQTGYYGGICEGGVG